MNSSDRNSSSNPIKKNSAPGLANSESDRQTGQGSRPAAADWPTLYWPTVGEWSVAVLLVAIGVLGRWGEPTWCFTPIGAAAIVAGFALASWKLAILVPIITLALGDLTLPGYGSAAIVLATYLCMTFPVLLGRQLRRFLDGEAVEARSGQKKIASLIGRVTITAVAPATLFFVVTNFAVWAFQSLYPKTLSGLADCYIAAIPFYRSMLAGDCFYLICLAACGYVAIASSRTLAKATSPNR